MEGGCFCGFTHNFYYLSEVRPAEARKQLSGGSARITEIAFACGFQSLSQFNRRFRATEGMSPSEYRKKAQSIG